VRFSESPVGIKRFELTPAQCITVVDLFTCCTASKYGRPCVASCPARGDGSTAISYRSINRRPIRYYTLPHLMACSGRVCRIRVDEWVDRDGWDVDVCCHGRIRGHCTFLSSTKALADHLQVAFSIYLAQAMTLFFWSKGLDPEYVARQINYRLADLFIAHIACPCTLV
jgi:hypothetical protein